MSDDVTDGLRAWCGTTVAAYLDRYPGEAGRLADLRSLLATAVPLHDRRTLPGHVTASGVVVHRPTRRVLLIHHNVLGRWLPPGGHLEAGERPADAAGREVAEETGVTVHGGALVDIDSHPIPANDKRGEPAHAHHDFRFAFDADPAGAMAADAAEVSAAEWVSFDDPRVPANLAVALAKLETPV